MRLDSRLRAEVAACLCNVSLDEDVRVETAEVGRVAPEAVVDLERARHRMALSFPLVRALFCSESFPACPSYQWILSRLSWQDPWAFLLVRLRLLHLFLPVPRPPLQPAHVHA